MNAKHLLTIAFCFIFSTVAAQSDNVPIPDSALVPRSLVQHTSFTYFDLADSFSKAGDTMNASRYLLQINPYYFLWEGTKPETIDTLFSRFALTIQAKDSFRRSFTDTFLSPRSASYKKFKAMFDEDQHIRNRLANCADSFTCASLETKMQTTDSPHFEFLHRYVVNNGWPSLRDGSLYAQVIALHNHDRHKFYAPLMKAAVLNGDVAPGIYNMLLHYLYMPKSGDESRFESPNKVVIDISSTLNFEMPDSTILKKIALEAKKHCPIRYVVFAYGSGDPKNDATKWFNEDFIRFKNENKPHIMSEIANWVHKDCECSKDNYMWQEDTHKQKKKMSLWLVY